MKEVKLCKNIQESLKQQGVSLSGADISRLFVSTLSNIHNNLKEGNTIDISDFGSFWSKEGETSSVTFFRPVVEFTDRINAEQQ